MPKPVYMIVSESGSIDRQRNSLSIFNVIDMFEVQVEKRSAVTDELPFAPTIKMFVSACWRVDDTEYHTDYEAEMAMDVPGGDTPQSLFKDKVQFSKPFHRFNARIEGPAMLTVPGDLTVTCRIRKAGAKKWISQSYSLIVQVKDHTPRHDPQEAESNT